MAAEPPLAFTYFPLWAKIAPAVALQHSGLEWVGKFGTAGEGGWPALKPQTPWGELPTLENTPLGTIGHELQILAFIAKRAGPALEGADEKEQLVSMQLMAEAEDIYAKLGKLKNGGTDEDKATFWSEVDPTKHNRDQGLGVYLNLLEKFHGAVGAPAGFFTASGISVGECKLWTTMHILKLAKPDVFEGTAALSAFYDRCGYRAKFQGDFRSFAVHYGLIFVGGGQWHRFTALPATQEVITTGGGMPGELQQ